MKSMVAGLRALSAPFGSPGWCFHPRLLNTLERLKDSTGRYLVERRAIDLRRDRRWRHLARLQIRDHGSGPDEPRPALNVSQSHVSRVEGGRPLTEGQWQTSPRCSLARARREPRTKTLCGCSLGGCPAKSSGPYRTRRAASVSSRIDRSQWRPSRHCATASVSGSGRSRDGRHTQRFKRSVTSLSRRVLRSPSCSSDRDPTSLRQGRR